MQQKQLTLSTQPPLFLFQKPQIMITGGFLFWGKHHTCWARCLLAHHAVSDWPFPHRQSCKNKVAKQKLCIRKLVEHTDINEMISFQPAASPKEHHPKSTRIKKDLDCMYSAPFWYFLENTKAKYEESKSLYLLDVGWSRSNKGETMGFISNEVTDAYKSHSLPQNKQEHMLIKVFGSKQPRGGKNKATWNHN